MQPFLIFDMGHDYSSVGKGKEIETSSYSEAGSIEPGASFR